MTIIHGESFLTLASYYAADTFDAAIGDPPYALVSVGDRLGNPDAAPIQYGTDGVYARAARFFYTAKASKADREEGLEYFALKAAGMRSDTSGQHITRRDEGYTLPERANNHPTVKPTSLMRYLCKLITPVGGHILDPFAGSGSTGKAAALEGFKFTGIEMDAEYVEIARARIAWAKERYDKI